MDEQDEKYCFDCKWFTHFHASAGICEEKRRNNKGCCVGSMIDGMDDICDKFKPKGTETKKVKP